MALGPVCLGVTNNERRKKAMKNETFERGYNKLIMPMLIRYCSSTLYMPKSTKHNLFRCERTY